MRSRCGSCCRDRAATGNRLRTMCFGCAIPRSRRMVTGGRPRTMGSERVAPCTRCLAYYKSGVATDRGLRTIGSGRARAGHLVSGLLQASGRDRWGPADDWQEAVDDVYRPGRPRSGAGTMFSDPGGPRSAAARTGRPEKRLSLVPLPIRRRDPPVLRQESFEGAFPAVRVVATLGRGGGPRRGGRPARAIYRLWRGLLYGSEPYG